MARRYMLLYDVSMIWVWSLLASKASHAIWNDNTYRLTVLSYARSPLYHKVNTVWPKSFHVNNFKVLYHYMTNFPIIPRFTQYIELHSDLFSFSTCRFNYNCQAHCHITGHMVCRYNESIPNWCNNNVVCFHRFRWQQEMKTFADLLTMPLI